MHPYLLVAAGGAIGAVARYGANEAALRLGLTQFPWATLSVNVVGGFLMGCLIGWVQEGSPELKLFLGVGVLGGFTTFSAFSLDTIRLLQTNQGAAIFYVLASILLSVGACWLGLVVFTRSAG